MSKDFCYQAVYARGGGHTSPKSEQKIVVHFNELNLNLSVWLSDLCFRMEPAFVRNVFLVHFNFIETQVCKKLTMLHQELLFHKSQKHCIPCTT